MTARRLLASLTAVIAVAASAAGPTVRSLDLARPFATRSPWRLTVAQGPPEADPIMADGGQVPGTITLCLSRDAGRACDPQPGTSLRIAGAPDTYDVPHAVRRVAIVRPRPDRPLLLVQLASVRSVNGDQRSGTELYAYDRAADRFRLVYRHQTDRNNNQEVRYIDAGPLRGAVDRGGTDAERAVRLLDYRVATRIGGGLSRRAAVPQCHPLW